MGTYQERVDGLIPPDYLGNGSAATCYRLGRDDAAVIAAEADARIAELEAALATLVAAVDYDGHYPEDCEVEGRTDCQLCAAIRRAFAALATPDAGAATGAALSAFERGGGERVR